MKTQTLVIALAATLLAGPATVYGQIEIGALKAGASEALGTEATVGLPGVAGKHAARVVGPPNFLQLMQRGTLRELELKVPPGLLSDAFARSHRTRSPLPSVGLEVKWDIAEYRAGDSGMWMLTNVRVTSYSVSGATDADKFARVKVQFHWDHTSPAAAEDRSEPIGLIEVVATSGPSAAAPSSDGFSDVIVGAAPARLARAGALQALTVGAAQSEPMEIEVQRGSALERLLRSSLAGGKVIPNLKLELSEPGNEARGRRVIATLSSVRVLASKRGNTIGMETITLSYEGVTID